MASMWMPAICWSTRPPLLVLTVLALPYSGRKPQPDSGAANVAAAPIKSTVRRKRRRDEGKVFPPPNGGRAREGEAAFRWERIIARFPHPNPPPPRGRGH